MKPILLQIYDYTRMFDSVDLEQALSDLYDVGVDDDTMVLLHKANKNVYMAVNLSGNICVNMCVNMSGTMCVNI